MAGEVTQASGEKVSSGTAAHHSGPPPQQPVMLGIVWGYLDSYSRSPASTWGSLGTL